MKHILKKFGTANPTEVLQKKQNGRQDRAVSNNAPTLVELTPDECAKLCKAVGVEYLEGYEARVIQYVFSDETVDRYGDIVRQAGADLENFNKNPVIQLFHNYASFPVGVSIKTWVDATEKKTKGYVLFLDNRVDASGTSDTAFKMAKSGVMKAGSIGFMPKAARIPNAEDRAKYGMPDGGIEYVGWELLEFTLCPVPANPNALQESVSKGLIRKADLLPLAEKKLIPKGIFSKIKDTSGATPIWSQTEEDFLYQENSFDAFAPDSIDGEHTGEKEVLRIFGKLKTGETATQGYYFARNVWTVEEAQAWIKSLHVMDSGESDPVTDPDPIATDTDDRTTDSDPNQEKMALSAFLTQWENAVVPPDLGKAFKDAITALQTVTADLTNILKGTGQVTPATGKAIPPQDFASESPGLYDDPSILAEVTKITKSIKESFKR